MTKLTKSKFSAILITLGLITWAGCSHISLTNSSSKNSKLEVKNLKDTKAFETEKEDSKDMGATYVERKKRQEKIAGFCKKIDKRFKKYAWGKSKCESYPWNFVRASVKGDPLIWMSFGNDSKSRKETTVIFCGVHGDEITPIKFCFDILNHIEGIHSPTDLEDRLIIVAPIVNPDSFFKKYPTRTNANGIDVNRNFPTADFKSSSMKLWKNRYKKDKRRYPGKVAMSEPETLFQVNLIKRYNPDKIISVHSPLTMLDYDGPADRHSGGVVGSSANQLLIQMSEQAKGYKIKNYPFFPGSLGNYAGNERNIPTYTLELPSSDNRRSKIYWKLFKDSIHSAIMHSMKKEIGVASKNGEAKSSKKN